MNFLNPTKSKLVTALLLIFLWLTYSSVSSAAKIAYKKYTLDLMLLSNYSKDIESSKKQCDLAAQSGLEKITTDVIRKIEIAGYFNISVQLTAGLLIAYFGSCVIHRKKIQ